MNNTEILNAIAQAVSDAKFTKRTEAIMLGILTDSQNYIIDKTECLRQTDSTSVVLVADKVTYDLPASYVKFPTEGADVKRAFVQIGTYGKYALTYMPQPVLNNRYPGWRQTASGTPEFYSTTEKGTPELIIYPGPSAAFIATNGTKVFMDMIYKPAALVKDTNLPFDNGYRFSGLFQILLKIRAIWQIKTEDLQFADADRLDKSTKMLFEEAVDFVRSMSISPGNHGFEEDMR